VCVSAEGRRRLTILSNENVVLGPTLIFDESFLQMLNPDEVSELSRYFIFASTPQLVQEIIADLKNEATSKDRIPEDVVKTLASRMLAVHGLQPAEYRMLAISNLCCTTDVPMCGQIPVDARAPNVAVTKDGRGTVYDATPVQNAARGDKEKALATLQNTFELEFHDFAALDSSPYFFIAAFVPALPAVASVLPQVMRGALRGWLCQTETVQLVRTTTGMFPPPRGDSNGELHRVQFRVSGNSREGQERTDKAHRARDRGICEQETSRRVQRDAIPSGQRENIRNCHLSLNQALGELFDSDSGGVNRLGSQHEPAQC
jgi:hypothetical protein